MNENFTWYDDNSLKTYPGPGYSRLLDYDEEARLTSIKRDAGGRRWRKDYDNNVWNWYLRRGMLGGRIS
ncbi:MAG: hypothetical protein ACR2HJ_06700 [Fimbriimonadales bacterium]